MNNTTQDTTQPRPDYFQVRNDEIGKQSPDFETLKQAQEFLEGNNDAGAKIFVCFWQ